MGNWFPREFVSIESVSRESEDRKFKSKVLSASRRNNKRGVKRGYDKFSENETDMELLSRQVTAVSRNDMMETLTQWKKELRLDPSDYVELTELFDVAENDHWPKHRLGDPLWETMESNNAMTNWLYFYVSRTDANSDARKFNVAICHLITNEPSISRYVLIGGLLKKNLLLMDNDYNLYLKFHH
jgi:hypothetical protein